MKTTELYEKLKMLKRKKQEGTFYFEENEGSGVEIALYGIDFSRLSKKDLNLLMDNGSPVCSNNKLVAVKFWIANYYDWH